MENLILCLIVFALSFLGRLGIYFFIKKRENKGKYTTVTDVDYLIKRFNLDKKKLDKLSIASIISFFDALIISVALFVAITATSNVMLEMMIGLVIVVLSIIVVNEIFGRILVKKGYDKK